MGYNTELYIAPRSALQKIADTPAATFPCAEGRLNYLTDTALSRLQALIDGVTEWGQAFDAVAIEFEDEDYAESSSNDGGWSRIVPDRFVRSFAALTDADIERLTATWSDPDTHSGRQLLSSEGSAMIREVRALASRAIGENSCLVFCTRE
ncbi:MAG TPA: hypothetical protein VFZ59_10715 [Verrucomicrobiae bacterium]|nr:hypothetical protein [Verrucomicrobiae bacterium]